jgi:hypothetical protein
MCKLVLSNTTCKIHIYITINAVNTRQVGVFQHYRTSVTKALRQPDGPQKDAVVKAIHDKVQQIIDVGAIAERKNFPSIRNPEIRCTG